MAFIEMRCVGEVTSGTEDAFERTPASGKTVTIKHFHGSAAFSQNSAVKLVWKYNHATEAEEVIWITKGEGDMPSVHVIPSSDVDGTRKLAVACDNGESGDLYMAGYALIEEV